MQIAAASPPGTCRATRCRRTCSRRKSAIYRAQMENSGKPANVIDKIVEGKLGSFYSQVGPARPGVDPRPEDDGQGRHRRGQQDARAPPSR